MKNKYKVQVNLLFMIVICMIGNISVAQRTSIPSNTCPNPNGSERAYFYVKSFLTFADSQYARIETGSTNETVEQIQPVVDQQICSILSQMLQNTPKYKNIEDNLDSKSTKYYYRTNNFLYVFWTRKPEYDNIPNTGPRKLFIVMSLDYQNIWEYYF